MTKDLEAAINRLNARLWPVEAVMERLSVGRTMVFELMANGELQSAKVGRRRLVSESAINEYISRLEAGVA